MKTERMKTFETEMEDFRKQRALEIQKQQNLNVLLYENLSSEKAERKRSFETEMEKFRMKNAEEIQKQQNLSAMLQVNDTLLNFLRAPVVVFTVTNPADGSSSDALTFTNEIINEGGGYDTASGRFTCPVGGIYYFNLHLVKAEYYHVDRVSCYIKKNGLDTVRVHSDPDDDYGDSGVYGVSNSVYLTLVTDDVVTVAGCYHYDDGAASTMQAWSSFSGYMVRPDILIQKRNDGG